MTSLKPTILPSPHANEGTCWPNPSQELLLTASLGDGEEALQAWEQWHKANDIDFLDSGSYRMLPLLHQNLTRLGVQAPVLERMKGVYRFHWSSNELLFHAFGKVLRSLREANIEALLLKGIPLAVTYYKQPGLRPMEDGDLLVHPDQFETAHQLMLSQGWRCCYENAFFHHSLTYKNKTGQKIDLHRFVIDECPYSPQDNEFWQHAVPICIGGVETRALDATDLLFHVVVHGIRWSPSSTLRWVTDSLLLLRSAEIDWPRLIRQAKRRRLTLATFEALDYLKRRFQAPIPNSVLNELQATRKTWIEKRERLAWTRFSPFTDRFWQLYGRYWRFEQEKKVSWLHFLQLSWNLKSPWQVPGFLVTRVWKRLVPKRS